jgi:hypothetical protein
LDAKKIADWHFLDYFMESAFIMNSPHDDPSPLRNHWDAAYEKSAPDQLGWFEEFPEPSLRLIEHCHLDKKARLLHVGAGASTLVDELVSRGYENLIANDLSSEALDRLQLRLGDHADRVEWIVDDLIRPKRLTGLDQVDLWHDRAVLHFFTDNADQAAYFDLLRKLVKVGGHVILSVYNLQGAQRCCGLPVHRCDEAHLQEALGVEFELIEAFDYTYSMPSGDTREYIYTLFQRSAHDMHP